MKKISNLTSELVFVGETPERFYYEFAKEVDPEFIEDKMDINITDAKKKGVGNDYWFNQASMVPINEIKKLVEKAEKKGSNYITIFFHGDHDNYVVYGTNLHPETKSEEEQRIIEDKKRLAEKQEEVKIKMKRFAAENGLKIKFV